MKQSGFSPFPLGAGVCGGGEGRPGGWGGGGEIFTTVTFTVAKPSPFAQSPRDFCRVMGSGMQQL